MKICIAGGHSKAAPGARDFLDEYTEDREVKDALIEELRARGNEVTDASNEERTQGAELRAECATENAQRFDLFMAIHFNAAGRTDVQRGTETWIYPGSSSRDTASKIAHNVANALRLPNRGVKESAGLYVLRHTKAPAVLVEVCFVDAKADADAYKQCGSRAVAYAIAEAVQGATMGAADHPQPEPERDSGVPFPLPSGHWYGTPRNDDRNHSGYYWKNDRPGIKRIQSALDCSCDGLYGPNTENAVRQYQAAHGLAADGCAGVLTWGKMF